MATEVTDEMVEAYRTAGRHIAIVDPGKVKMRIAAVLAIVDRDNREITRQAYERGQRDERALKEMGF